MLNDNTLPSYNAKLYRKSLCILLFPVCLAGDLEIFTVCLKFVRTIFFFDSFQTCFYQAKKKSLRPLCSLKEDEEEHREDMDQYCLPANPQINPL